MHLRPELAFCLCLALGPSPLAAAGSGESRENFQESIVELRLNDQPETHTIVAWRGSDPGLLIDEQQFEVLRLRRPAVEAVQIDGKAFYPLGAIRGLSIDIDERQQSADVTAPVDAFVPSYTDLSRPNVSKVDAVGYGGFLNYDASVTHERRTTVAGAFMEPGIYMPQGVLTSTFTVSTGGQQSGLTRLDTVFVHNIPERIETIRIGDAISASGGWGQSVRFGGIQFGTNFATQPGLITTPLLGTSGEALVPSTVDVFLNGQRVAQQDVPPGPFTLDGVPAVTGAGEMQVVVTDALGRQQVMSQPFYSGRQLLQAGLNDYSLELGFIRRDFARRSNAYGDWVFAGTWRRGLTNQLTAEVHAEAKQDGSTAAGLDIAFQLGRYGILSTALANGGDSAGRGWLTGLGFEHNGRRYSTHLRSQFSSQHFAQIGSSPETRRPRARSFAGFGVHMGQAGSLQLAAGHETFWNASESGSVGLNYTVTPPRIGSLGLSVTHRRYEDQEDLDVYLSWTRSLSRRRTANAAVGYGPRGDTRAIDAAASIQKSLPAGSGTGYLMSASTSGDALLGYSLQGRPGTVEFEFARRNGQDGWRASAIGGAAFTSAGVYASRNLDRSFAVLEFDGYPGLTVLHENQPIGRTDKRGRFLLDGLRAYEENSISLRPNEIPMDASLASESMTFTPAWRSGAVLHFPIERAHAATLTLVQADGTPIPAGARARLGDSTFPVALDGMLYVTGLADEAEIEVNWRDLACRAAVRRPQTDEPIPDLGAVTCVAHHSVH